LTQKSNKKSQGCRKIAKKDFIPLQRKSLKPSFCVSICRRLIKYIWTELWSFRCL